MWGNLKGNKCDSRCIFSWEPLFCEQVPSSFDPIGFFFEIFLTPLPLMFSTALPKSMIYSFTKKALPKK